MFLDNSEEVYNVLLSHRDSSISIKVENVTRPTDQRKLKIANIIKLFDDIQDFFLSRAQ